MTPLIYETWAAPNGVPCMVRQYVFVGEDFDLRVGLRVWTVDMVRLAAQIPAPAPWPRWCFEPMNGMAILALREKTGEAWASLRRVIRPKGEVVWWHHAPKKCNEQKVPDLETGAEALAARGLPVISTSLLDRLRAWTLSA